MHRQWILNKLETYKGFDLNEEQFRLDLINFIQNNKNCFASTHPPVRENEQENQVGHITGSAWVLSKNKDKTLLTHHRKLNMWLQLGGHSDDHPNVLETAHREACEESGIPSLVPLSEDIFDIDIHRIPEKKNIPSHLHYDIRFLFHSPETDDFQISDESMDLKWISLKEVENYNSSESLLRMCKKLI